MWSHHARRLLVALALGGKVSRIALVGIAWPYIILLRVEKRVGNAQFESNSKRVGSKDSAVATQWHTSTGGPLREKWASSFLAFEIATSTPASAHRQELTTRISGFATITISKALFFYRFPESQEAPLPVGYGHSSGQA